MAELATPQVAFPSVDLLPPISRAIEALARSEAAAVAHRAAIARFDQASVDHRAIMEESQRAIAARETARVNRAEMRAAVEKYVRQLRAESVEPHHMLIAVKRAFFAAATSLPTGCKLVDPESISADVVRWAIDAYYAAA